MPVGHRVGKHVREFLIEKQTDHGKQAGVQGIDVGTVGVERQLAVQPAFIEFGNERQGITDNMVQIIVRVRGGNKASGERRIRLDHGAGGSAHRRRVVGAVDGQKQNVGRSAAMPV